MTECVVANGDCLQQLGWYSGNSFDAVVTDPPYELNLLGKGWDRSGIAYSVELWNEVHRVLKPGGHLLAFSATRTVHRMTSAIEDAGFDVRDQLAWQYLTGMAKSRDVSLAIDNHLGATRTQVIGHKDSGYDKTTEGTMTFVNDDGVSRWPSNRDETGLIPIYAPATPEATRWHGWGTRLKPEIEPVVKARKPFIGTVAENVLAWGVGGINLEHQWPSNLIYCPKPSRLECDAGLDASNPHPTPKPIELMRKLVRLVTPPGGLVLDPFFGSGATGIAAHLEGFSCVGIEREASYAEVARQRVEFWRAHGESALGHVRTQDESERIQAELAERGQEALF